MVKLERQVVVVDIIDEDTFDASTAFILSIARGGHTARAGHL